MHKVELILSQFGKDSDTVEPALSSFKRFFPESIVTLYTDNINYNNKLINTINVVNPIFSKNSPRYGWHCSDLYRAIGLLQSKSEIAIYSDADMIFFSNACKHIIHLTEKFGICVPANPRLLMRNDALVGEDCDKILDETEGYGAAYNTSPISLNTRNIFARKLLEEYVKLMTETPQRNPVILYRAAWNTGIYPYVLPYNWCVCKEHIGIGSELILHSGHRQVLNYYTKKHSILLKLLLYLNKKIIKRIDKILKRA